MSIVLNLNVSRRLPSPPPRFNNVANVCPRCGRLVRGVGEGLVRLVPLRLWQDHVPAGRFGGRPLRFHRR